MTEPESSQEHPQHGPLGLVVAVSDNGVIGRGGALPWDVPEDLKHFRRLTTGHTVIMGRRTHESIGRALPKRRNIVVTRGEACEGCEVVPTLDEAITRARDGGDSMPMVIGGAALYEEALPWATHLFITEIGWEVEGDTYFPAIDRSIFHEVERSTANTPGVSFVTMTRNSS